MSAPEINRARLPHFWSGMSFTAKAACLVTQRQARDFSEACSMLARSRRRPPARPTAEQYQAQLEKRGIS